jgi:hypothetical protein
MKSYRQFIAETKQFDEGFWQAVGKGLSYATGGKVAPAAKIFNAVAGAHAVKRGIESAGKGDEFGLYNAGAMAIPVGGGPMFNALKLGGIGVDLMRTHRDRMKKEEEKRKNKIQSKN